MRLMLLRRSKTCQPRAERSAALGHECRKIEALKGRHNACLGPFGADNFVEDKTAQYQL